MLFFLLGNLVVIYLDIKDSLIMFNGREILYREYVKIYIKFKS